MQFKIKNLIAKPSKFILKYFLQGLLYLTPISITVFAAYKIFEYIDNILPFKFPGLGFIVLFVTITLFGFLVTRLVASPLIHYFSKLLDKFPFIKMFYTSIKDFVTAFVRKKKKFKIPVLVTVNINPTIERIGFITQESIKEFEVNEDIVAVYLPHSYSISGNLILIEKKYIRKIDVPSAEIMKYIISGGITQIDKNAKMAEKDENEQL